MKRSKLIKKNNQMNENCAASLKKKWILRDCWQFIHNGYSQLYYRNLLLFYISSPEREKT